MASLRKIAANRRNAKRSTGPKSADGRSRSAQNARRHGLSVPISADLTLSEEARALTAVFLAELGRQALREYAERAAEAQLELNRVRALKRQMTQAVTEIPEATSGVLDRRQSPECDEGAIQDIRRLERYERRAWSRRNTTLRELDFAHRQSMTIERDVKVGKSKPKKPSDISAALSGDPAAELSPELAERSQKD